MILHQGPRESLWRCLLLSMMAVSFVGCSSKYLKIENSEQKLKIEEYDQLVKVKELQAKKEASEAEAAHAKAEAANQKAPPVDKKNKKEIMKVKKVETVKSAPPPILEKKKGRQPELEDKENFEGRRPKVDPFRVGEKTVLKMMYFNVTAGDLVIETLPYVEVNDRKSYRFRISIKSNSLFSSFYSVDDYAETFMDFEQLVPYSYTISVKESKQLREVRSYMDWKKSKAKFWQRRVDAEGKVENKDIDWEIEPYAQNVFTAIYYLRTFNLKVGKKIQFRVADEGRNMVVSGEVVRKEVLKTDAGDLPTLVLKPTVEIKGVFQPMGEIFFWLTDDDQKQLVRIESKIKIGKVVGMLRSIERGEKLSETPPEIPGVKAAEKSLKK